jgi:hypothetical protein
MTEQRALVSFSGGPLTVELSVEFPSEAEKFQHEVARYRDSSATVRFQAVFELYALCESLLAASPNRKQQLRLLGEKEELEHRSWRELIRKHVES